jgi:beta-aspartyl-peptidase (threonine type)
MKRPTLLIAAVLAACTRPVPEGASLPDRQELTRILVANLDRSAEDWNRGDLDGFLSAYAPDSQPTFFASGHLRRGLAFVRSYYAPRFGPGATRDSLHFEEINVRPLGPIHAVVTARFILSRAGQTTASGPFTLVMERRPDGWKILHDHSSSDPR